MATLISADGQDGAALERGFGIRLVGDDSQALVLKKREKISRDGRHGKNAAPAIHGGPAGTLVVQLSESNRSQGAIHVQRRRNQSTHHIPETTEVPVGRDIRLTAIGGKGEPGGSGGDGQQGLNGQDGTDASEADDATDGTDGGRGGDAGRGSSGGDGGRGGEIYIIVNEESTHLLMAISCDVRGGEGGFSGNHGIPGAGGKGGKGGQGWKWTRIIGYKPFCTDSCIKSDETAGSSNALAKTTTHFSATTKALRAQTQALVVRGNNVQSVIAQAAIKYKAMGQPRRDAGYCRCGGGTGSCQGCDVKPIWTTLTRAPGLDGKDGEKGKGINTLLVSGCRGKEGSFTIAVRLRDGSMHEYFAPWSLELVDFEVEDENGDGIFEPGEHVFIRRVKVRNIGGMPSPTCKIPITLADNSEWFESVPDHAGGVAYLPTSIPAGGSASTTGSIKVRVKNADQSGMRLPAFGVHFSAKDTLKIRADMPWLDRRMPSFDITKEINISYPCKLSSFEHLSTITQGAVGKIKYKVNNMSNHALGESDTLGLARTVQVRTIIPGDIGQLSTDSEEEHQQVMRTVPYTRPNDSIEMHQHFRILSNARSHKHFPIIFELWLESPTRDQDSEMVEEILVERHAIRLQVSNTYIRNENSNFLLITNPNTTERQSLGIQNFVRNNLGMEIDVCNIHQNGGLLNPRENDFDEPLPLISAYRKKAILILDNPFEFFDAGNRTTSELCDPQWLSQLLASGTSILFLGCEAGNAFERIVRPTVLPTLAKLEDTVKQIQRSRLFSSKQELVESIIQERQFGSARVGVSAIPLQASKWYRFGRDKAMKQGNKLVDYLHNRLPNERFLVTYVASKQRTLPRHTALINKDMISEEVNTARGSLVVLTGLDHHCCVVSTESSIIVNPDSNCLDSLSKYNIIASLPSAKRIFLLWKNGYSDGFITKALTLTVVRDIFQQLSGFLSSSHDLLSDINTMNTGPIDTLLKTHLPCISELIHEAQAGRYLMATGPIREVIQWTLSFTAGQKRLDSLVRLMIANCQSTQHLKDYIPLPSFDPSILVQRISALTKTPENIFTRGQISTADVIPRTRLCTPQEWDNMVQIAMQWRERIKNDMAGAQKQLDKMIIDIQTDKDVMGWERAMVGELAVPMVELDTTEHG